MPVPAKGRGRTGGVAFLLAQIGAHAAERFGERIAQLDLTPPQTGLLRAVAAEPGRSQQAVAEQLRIQPSRFVALVDELSGAVLSGGATRPTGGSTRCTSPRPASS